MTSVKIVVGEKFRRSKLPSVKNSVGQNGRRSKWPSVKIAVGQNGRRSKLRQSKDLEHLKIYVPEKWTYETS
jgi:predicted NAD-dependent protein-ADP-ribosyltransferase YbiA (DUF1768 family)